MSYSLTGGVRPVGLFNGWAGVKFSVCICVSVCEAEQGRFWTF